MGSQHLQETVRAGLKLALCKAPEAQLSSAVFLCVQGHPDRCRVPSSLPKPAEWDLPIPIPSSTSSQPSYDLIPAPIIFSSCPQAFKPSASRLPLLRNLRWKLPPCSLFWADSLKCAWYSHGQPRSELRNCMSCVYIRQHTDWISGRLTPTCQHADTGNPFHFQSGHFFSSPLGNHELQLQQHG